MRLFIVNAADLINKCNKFNIFKVYLRYGVYVVSLYKHFFPKKVLLQ